MHTTTIAPTFTDKPALVAAGSVAPVDVETVVLAELAAPAVAVDAILSASALAVTVTVT